MFVASGAIAPAMANIYLILIDIWQLAAFVLPLVLRVGHVRSPVRAAFGDGQMGQEMIGTGAVPVLFAVGSEDDIAGPQFDDLLAPGLHSAAPLGDVERLAAVVGMPGGAGTRGEVHGGHVERGRRQAP